ncbi:MAG: signal peptidase II, partial [Selenomonas bovis]|nr:signal peptidase II [Selenomonas bovis]
DRIASGLVVDFLDFRIWPVFNLADIAIVGGVIGMMLVILFPARFDADAERRRPHG